MAQISDKFYIMVLVLSFLLILSHTESRILTAAGGKTDAVLNCTNAVGAESGDTCQGVATQFNLTLDEFLAVNPNINCDSMFVGQWLCIAGSA
nr:lysM domain-containing protein ARB_03442 [Ipomoea batatas]